MDRDDKMGAAVGAGFLGCLLAVLLAKVAFWIAVFYLVVLGIGSLSGCASGPPPGYLGDCDERGMCSPGLTCTSSFYAEGDACVAVCDRTHEGYCEALMGNPDAYCSDGGEPGDGECVVFCEFTSDCPDGTRCYGATCANDDGAVAFSCRVCNGGSSDG